MKNRNPVTLGEKIKFLRKRKGYKQQDLADILDKSLRTIQKYESGEIDVSISTIYQLAEVLDTTPTFLVGYNKVAPFYTLADVFSSLFNLDPINGLDFSISVEKPPRWREWRCSLSFSGKVANADFNADMCLFLEDWEKKIEDLQDGIISQEEYDEWKESTLAYYAPVSLDRKRRGRRTTER